MNLDEKLAYVWLRTKAGYLEKDLLFHATSTPDFLATKNGMTIGYEVKATTGDSRCITLRQCQLIALCKLPYALVIVFYRSCIPVLIPIQLIRAGFRDYQGIHICVGT